MRNKGKKRWREEIRFHENQKKAFLMFQQDINYKNLIVSYGQPHKLLNYPYLASINGHTIWCRFEYVETVWSTEQTFERVPAGNREQLLKIAHTPRVGGDEPMNLSIVYVLNYLSYSSKKLLGFFIWWVTFYLISYAKPIEA